MHREDSGHPTPLHSAPAPVATGDSRFGQNGNDQYRISLVGGTTSTRIEVTDSGTGAGDTDVLVVTGTSRDDQFLLRVGTSPSIGLAFVAMINEGENIERVNYDGVERMLVNGSRGNDRFAVDDTRTETTLDGGLGNDSFQIGQLYKSRRTQEEANLDPRDAFEPTIETTRGFLSNGITKPMTVFGGAGADDFVVLHNMAVLSLNGGDGDDTFAVRAFALAGSQDSVRDRNDEPGIVITESEGGTYITEEGRIDSYTVVLTQAPLAAVLLTVAAPLRTEDDEKRGTRAFRVTSNAVGAQNNPEANTVVLRFTVDNWSVPQTVDVTALDSSSELLDYDDDVAEGVLSGVITHTVTVEEGPLGFPADAIVGSSTAATAESLTDNSAPFPTQGDGLRGRVVRIVEGPGAGEQLLVLSNTATTLTLRGRWRTVPTADSRYVIQRYQDLAAPGVMVTIYDNDTASVIVNHANSQTPAAGDGDGSTDVVEGGATDQLEFTLSKRPSATVTIDLNGGPQLGLSANQLRFDASNWNVPQVITVTAVDDTAREGFHHGAIILSNSLSTEPAFHGIATPPILVSVADNDVSQVLIRETLGATNVIEGGTSGDLIPFTDTYAVVLTRQPAANVTVSLLPQITKSTTSGCRAESAKSRSATTFCGPRQVMTSSSVTTARRDSSAITTRCTPPETASLSIGSRPPTARCWTFRTFSIGRRMCIASTCTRRERRS